jgi:hypothetical protein
MISDKIGTTSTKHLNLFIHVSKKHLVTVFQKVVVTTIKYHVQ